MNDTTRLHLAALLRTLRPDWPEPAIGAGIRRLDETDLPDTAAALSAIACAADPTAHPSALTRYRVKPVEVREPPRPNRPNPTVNRRGAAKARAALGAATAARDATLPLDNPPETTA